MAVIQSTFVGRKHTFTGSGFHRGGSLNPSNETIKREVSQINNASAPIPGLGTGPRVNLAAKQEFRPSGTSISYGGGIHHGLSQLNFNVKKQKKNVKLRA
jgi:hypothetical protein